MSRGKISTIAGFLLCWLVVMGGWLLTEELLDQKEEKLLGKVGQISLQSSEIAFPGEEAEGTDTLSGDGNQNKFVGVTLSEEEMAVVLGICETGGTMVLHEPAEGQMNMEQAITEGKHWIIRLADNHVLPSYLAECSFDRTNAQRYTIDTENFPAGDLFSFWQVSYEKEDMNIELMIHAASGQIWRAAVTMKEERMLVETGAKQGIFKLVFPFMEEGAFTMTDNKSNITYSGFAGGEVYAAMKQEALLIDGEEPMIRLRFWLCTSGDF